MPGREKRKIDADNAYFTGEQDSVGQELQHEHKKARMERQPTNETPFTYAPPSRSHTGSPFHHPNQQQSYYAQRSQSQRMSLGAMPPPPYSPGPQRQYSNEVYAGGGSPFEYGYPERTPSANGHLIGETISDARYSTSPYPGGAPVGRDPYAHSNIYSYSGASNGRGHAAPADGYNGGYHQHQQAAQSQSYEDPRFSNGVRQFEYASSQQDAYNGHHEPYYGEGHPQSLSFAQRAMPVAVDERDVTYTTDAGGKVGPMIKRKCYNCGTTSTATWRRSTCFVGKILCNKCGLFERTHSKPRPISLDSSPRPTRTQVRNEVGQPSAPRGSAGGQGKAKGRKAGAASASANGHVNGTAAPAPIEGPVEGQFVHYSLPQHGPAHTHASSSSNHQPSAPQIDTGSTNTKKQGRAKAKKSKAMQIADLMDGHPDTPPPSAISPTGPNAASVHKGAEASDNNIDPSLVGLGGADKVEKEKVTLPPISTMDAP